MGNRLYLASIVCGAAPLVVGTSIFALWYLTRAEAFAIAGIYTIYGGLVLALTGLACLGVYVLEHRGPTRRWLKAAFPACLILLNGPACYLIVLAVWDIETRYVVTVQNESDVAIETFILTGPGVHEEWVEIRPGERTQVKLFFTGPGSVEYQAVVMGQEFNGFVDPYVTSGVGGDVQMQFTANREFIGDLTSEIRRKHGI